MPNAVEPIREHMDHKAADELGGGEAHDGSSVVIFDPVTFPPERNVVGIGTDQAAV